MKLVERLRQFFTFFPFTFISITLGQHFITCRFSIPMQPSRLCHCFRIYIHVYTSRDRVDGSYIYISNPAIAFPGNFPQWSRWTGKVSTVRTDNTAPLKKRANTGRSCCVGLEIAGNVSGYSERSDIIRGKIGIRESFEFSFFFFFASFNS